MSGITAILGARGQRATNVRPLVSFTFDEIVALFNPNVVSYWKYEGIVATVSPDEKGIANATVTGSPELNIPTIVKRDTISDGAPTDGKCIAWQRVPGEYAQVAHNAAYKTASGTIVVHFQRDTGTAEKSQLVESDNLPAGTAGGMAIGINTNGAPDAYIRGAGGVVFSCLGGFNDVLIDRAYTLIFRWGSPEMSLSLWDDTGFMIRRNTNPSTIGLSATSTIRFGATHNDTNHHDGPYGRVVWMNRRITDDEEVVLAQAKSIVHSADLYRGLELGMGPLSLWGMGELAGTVIQDAVGSRNGTFSGTVVYNSPDLPQNSINGAVNFAGTGSGTVPHATTFDNLSAYSLSFWFRPNTIFSEGAPALPLVIKSSGDAVQGHMSCYLASANQDVLRLRVRNATTNFDISTPDNSIGAGVRYHVCIRGGNTGVDLHLDGKFIGKATGHTIGLVGNTQPWQLAWGLDFAALGNCVLDEICLFSRVITVSEIAALAQRTSSPVAIADSATVIESTVDNVIDVIDNDDYVGLPTIQIISQPSPDSVAIVAAANTLPYIEYTAGAVSAGGATRSFQYRISDVNGISNTVTCPVTVQDTGFVPVSIANCFTIGAATTTVNSAAALEDAVNAAAPGDNIVIPPGSYSGGSLTFTAVGTEANPIIIRPTTGRNNVTFSNAVWRFGNNSARIVVYGLNFTGGGTVNPTNHDGVTGTLDINGSHHRITRCQFRQINACTCWVRNATDTRIDHCDFAGYVNPSPNDRNCVYMDDIAVRNNALERLLVDYCYFHDLTRDPDQGGLVPILYTGGSAGTGRANGHVIFDHCLAENINTVGGSEVIIIKQSGVTIRYSTFRNMGAIGSGQYIQQRQGAGVEIRSCWFSNTGSGTPIRIPDYEPSQAGVGEGPPLIIGNNIRGTGNLSIARGSGEPAKNEQPGGDGFYNMCCNARVIGNILQNGQILIGNFISGGGLVKWEYPPGSPSAGLARDNHFQANVREAGQATLYNMQDEATSVFHPQDAPLLPGFVEGVDWEPAVQLNTSDVGLGAPDPLCP